MSDNRNVTERDQTTNVTQTGQTRNTPKQALAPAVDIAETESGITLVADMPGVAKDRLTIKVEGDNLTIEGQAQVDVPENIELLHSEVRSPYFRRSFTLSRDLDPAKIEATLKNGVLQMHIPKSEEARPKRIDVKVA
jgi:HSP20 family molecular chaperone IbpA